MNITRDLNLNTILTITSIFTVLNLYLVIKLTRLKSSFFFFWKSRYYSKIGKNIAVKNADSIGVVTQ